jgi:hypothetical protein
MGLLSRFRGNQAGKASDPTAEGSKASEAVEKSAELTAAGVLAAAAEMTGRKPKAEDPPAAPAEEPKPADEPKPEEDKPAEDAAPEEPAADPAPEEPKPEDDKPEEEAPAAGSHELFKRLAKDHGAEFASMAVDNGWSYAQALEARVAGLEGDLKASRDRFATMAKANGGLGAEDGASFEEQGSEKAAAVKSYEDDGASEGVARFAASITVKGTRN